MAANTTQSVPCLWCRTLTPHIGTKQCDRCYELSERIRADMGLARIMIRRFEATDSELRLLAALQQSNRALGEAREMLGVFEDHGGHDGLGGKGYVATLNHIDDAASAIKHALAGFRSQSSTGDSSVG